MNLKDKVVLITGGRRIGTVVAPNLALKGAHIAITYRSELGEMADLIKKVEAQGQRCLSHRADVSKEEEVNKLIDDVYKNLGRIDVLINMASIFKKRPFEKLTGSDWDEDVDVNAKSVFLTSKAVAPYMKKQGSGKIINFADWIAASNRPHYTHEGYLTYYAGKYAVIGLTLAFALQLAPKIQVNAIAPGPILPPPDLTEEENKEVIKQTPLGRWGGAAEIAKAVNFLIDSDFMTGEVIRVDGGRHLL